MKLRVGTSGYSFKEWKGPFYPEGIPPQEMLRYYAERLPAVEINNTFYRLPKASVLEAWADQVPEDFRFALKASRRITHFKRLKGAGDETEYFLRTTRSLGARLGVLLFQLSPKLEADLPRLEAFLDLLPDGTRAAFEFRHPSWFEDPVYDRLRERDFALCTVDDGCAGPEITRTASFGYLRLRGQGYERADLASWAAAIGDQGWEEAFVFFKHEEAGAGPALAMRFLEVAGRAESRRDPIAAPPSRPSARERKTG